MAHQPRLLSLLKDELSVEVAMELGRRHVEALLPPVEALRSRRELSVQDRIEHSANRCLSLLFAVWRSLSGGRVLDHPGACYATYRAKPTG